MWVEKQNPKQGNLSELYALARKIELKTKRTMNAGFIGQYHSAFKGRGMSFHDVREYTPGDDVRHIDWNVSARLQNLYIKTYVEERELTLCLIVDKSSSTYFSSTLRSKSMLIAEIGATLSFSAMLNQDRVALISVHEDVETKLPPNRSRTQIRKIISELLREPKPGQGTNLSEGLEHVRRMRTGSMLCFVLSDFHDPNVEQALSLLKRKHDVVCMSVNDPWESELINIGVVPFQDIETGQILWVDTTSPRGRWAFKEMQKKQNEARDQVLNRVGVDHVKFTTEQSASDSLARYFRTRAV